MGPTPPGTGVMAPACFTAASKSTSPTSLVLRLDFLLFFGGLSLGTRLIPTSMTIAPFLIQSPLTIKGRPTAATRISARAQTAAKSLVREWAMVTVQFCSRNKNAAGLPTKIDRPTITQCLPDKLSPSLRACLARMTQPSGVQGRSPGLPKDKRPALISVRPSTSLAGSISPITLSVLMSFGSGNCTNIPSTLSSILRSWIKFTIVFSSTSAGSLCSMEPMPASRVNLCLLRT